MSTKLIWSKFEPLFGSWSSKIKPFFDSGGFEDIYKFLREESKNGKKICPASMNTYRIFKECNFNDLQCVILVTEPYNKFIDGSPIASGVALDSRICARTQPELQFFYDGIEKELFNGLNLNYINEWDLSYLTNQGVLILNCALTVEKDKPNSHLAIWYPFIEFLLQDVISTTGVPIIFIGKEPEHLAPLVSKTNPTFITDDISRTWDTKGAFTWVSKCIWENNKESILWMNIDPPF